MTALGTGQGCYTYKVLVHAGEGTGATLNGSRGESQAEGTESSDALWTAGKCRALPFLLLVSLLFP